MSGADIEPVLHYSRAGGVGILTLNRSRSRNALNTDLLAQLNRTLDEALDDPEIGALVLTGNGPAFCAGADLKEAMSSPRPPGFWDRYSGLRESDRINHRLHRLPKPVVAAVNGFAVGAGCALAISCDVVFAADTARFGYPEVPHGIVASTVAVSLSRVVGRLHALDLLLSGRLVDAEEARGLGLVNRVVPGEELVAAAVDYATVLAGHPPVALRLTKELFRHVQELDYDRALEYARDVGQMSRESPDRRPAESAQQRQV